MFIKLLDPESDPNLEQKFRIWIGKKSSDPLGFRFGSGFGSGTLEKTTKIYSSNYPLFHIIFHNFQYSKGKVAVIAWYLEPIFRNIWTFQVPKALQQCTVNACSRRLSRYSVTMHSPIQVPLQKWNYKSVFVYTFVFSSIVTSNTVPSALKITCKIFNFFW